MEKSDLLPPVTATNPISARKRLTAAARIRIVLLTFVAAVILHIYARGCYLSFRGAVCAWNYAGRSAKEELCPQVDPLIPSKHKGLWDDVGASFDSSEFKDKAVAWLGGAVRIPTESFDKMGPIDEDPRWLVFPPFHEYLLTVFPLIHTTLKLTKVNTYGLLYEWEGTDTSLKPLLLAAHQDVVPVDSRTVDEWVHPPFSGYFDGQRIWGRGSSDDKSGLIGIMSSIETLISTGFKPTRKVVLAFGFDEETSGLYGARMLGEYMLSTFGENAFAMLVDEGAGFSEEYGSIFAVPGVGEKGYLDVRVEVSSPGGHSSVPPDHTSIGILSALLVHYERNPYPITIARGSPVYGTLQCQAAHGTDMDASLRKTIIKSIKSDRAMKKLEQIVSKDLSLRSLIGTTQAIDLISGGVKANALPEQAWAVVDHRIATQSFVDEVKKRDTALLEHLAMKFNLSYTAFGEEVYTGTGPKFGSLAISDAWGTALEPAPITPTDGEAYKLLSGTIKATFNAHRKFKNTEEIHVAPGIMTGNTDTRYYWKLTENIFRYNHGNAGSGRALGNGVHTVNESTDIDAFLEMIRFFTTLILNTDESSQV